MIFVGLVALVIAIVALIRVRRIDPLAHRVSELENDLTDLRRRFNVLQRQVPGAQPAPAPAPEPAPEAAPKEPERPAPPPPPPLPRPVPPEPKTAAAVKPPFDWERWIGIRGAAVLGGIALALAGLLFFQYSIQHGLISKTMRFALGLVVGGTCVGGSELVRRRGYRPAAEGLAGAGVVVLYAALWAGFARYQLVPLWLAFALMALVTATCGLIAVGRSAPLVAVLGVVGGFATPLLLSLERDRPIGLFGYVLLLNVGFIAVGRRERWPWIGLVGLGGTTLLEVLWIGARTGPGGLLTALGILTAFAVLFTVAGASSREKGDAAWSGVQAGGLLVPFLFAIYYAARIDLGPHLWGVAAFVLILGGGAAWTARRFAMPPLALAAAVASVMVLAVWIFRSPAPSGKAWEAAAIACLFALLYHAFLELSGPTAGLEGAAPAASGSASGSFLVLLVASLMSAQAPPWPWLAAWLVLGVLVLRQAGLTGLPALQPVSMAAVAAALSLQHIAHLHAPGFPQPRALAIAILVVAVLAQVVPLLRSDEAMRRMAEHGAALAAAILSFSILLSPLRLDLPHGLALGVPLVLGVLMLLAATRLPSGEWGLASVLVTSLVHASWTLARPEGSIDPGPAAGAMVIMLVAVAVHVLWPFVARRLATTRWIWWAAAAAGPLWFFPMKELWTIWRGTSAIGLLPVALGSIAFAAALAVRRAATVPDAPRRSALVGLSAVAICFASVAIPLQLDKSWVTIGWALEGLGLVLLWRRLDHAGLKWFGLAHLMAAALRLVPTMELLNAYPRSGFPVVNWILYTYLVPAAATFAAAWLLAPSEVSRARPFERELYAKGRPWAAVAASVAGIFVVFVWINVAIADWFTEGQRLSLRFGRAPARDLTVSIAWASYALVLLGFGMARNRTGLRWMSLGFLLVTIAKVFLYDLGELRDLYRVLSLVGLALSLLLVSVLYQRFVFRPRAGEAG